MKNRVFDSLWLSVVAGWVVASYWRNSDSQRLSKTYNSTFLITNVAHESPLYTFTGYTANRL
ncbi:hypothetical protein [Spirosoma daeguense]